ncbi:hypothetical protein [Nocardia asiatica]|uniref:hypothetical protein n=1 Tax=Nocardia asiatica TaxID=209252 RepID=UPI002458F491|nr:hypothetical protein [Nocardia asiatica]
MRGDSYGGYTSRAYEHLEVLAENLDYAPRDQQEAALKRYLDALHANAKERAKQATPSERIAELTQQRDQLEKARKRRAEKARLKNPDTNTWRIA